ncbi:MAG TPA: hemolysin III family protein [Blastocatellia bacterium]|jgi:hemolysin III|nr:hemolysin III family protein [Blastocatellia bacterium]
MNSDVSHEVKDRLHELANSITHGVGLALSVAGFGVLLSLAILRGNAWHIAGCSVYGASLVFLYAASTLYHSLRSPRAKHVLKVLDHSAIFLLIAGTYTPFTLVSLRGFWGWLLFALVWSLCVFGIVFKVFFVNRLEVLTTILYVAMGWVCVIAVKPLLAAVPVGGIAWLLAGGLFYTAGIYFFATKRVPYGHAIWHVFVLAGSICHFFAVFFYVLPVQA